MILDLDTRPSAVTVSGDEFVQAGAEPGAAASEPEPNPDNFARSRQYFEALVNRLAGEGAAGLTRAELEQELQLDTRELFRRLYEGHLHERARADTMRSSAQTGCEGTLPSPATSTP